MAFWSSSAMGAAVAKGFGVSPTPWGMNLINGVSRLVLIPSIWSSLPFGQGMRRRCADAPVLASERRRAMWAYVTRVPRLPSSSADYTAGFMVIPFCFPIASVVSLALSFIRTGAPPWRLLCQRGQRVEVII